MTKPIDKNSSILSILQCGTTVLRKRNFPPRNRQNNFFLLMWGKSFLDHCIMARVSKKLTAALPLARKI